MRCERVERLRRACGKKHQEVLDAGDTWHGSTVHFVTEELDGGPRILQGRLRVDPNETADALCARVQSLEHRIYPEAADWFAHGRLDYREHVAWLDGKKLDTNLGTAYEYGAGINIHGPRGELYASINSLTAQPDGLAPRDKTWVDVGGEYAVNDNFRIGFEASTTIDGAVVPYESIYAPKALHQYR